MRSDLHRFLLLASALVCVSTASATPVVEWKRQLRTPYHDEHFNMALDGSGDVLIVGQTFGIFGSTEAPSYGGTDAFVAKYDSSGNAIWAQTLGVQGNDSAWGVASDANGDIYVVGTSQNALDGFDPGGASSSSGYDGGSYLAKYDGIGSLLWTTRVNGLVPDPSFTYWVSIDANKDIYTAGYSFFNRLDADGSEIWTRGISWPGRLTYISRVVPDGAGNLYVSGRTTTGSDEISDVFLAKFDNSGSEIWRRIFGSTAHDNGGQVLLDDLGGIYVAGYTYGDFATPNAGDTDIFVTRWDEAGNLLWQTQFGTEASESARLTAAPGGGVYFAAATSLSDSPMMALFGEINPEGVVLWKEQYELKGSYPAQGIVTFDERPVAYYTTAIAGSPDDVFPFSYDILLVKLSVVPEPTTAALAMLGTLSFYSWRRSNRQSRVSAATLLILPRSHIPNSDIGFGGHNASIIAGAAA